MTITPILTIDRWTGGQTIRFSGESGYAWQLRLSPHEAAELAEKIGQVNRQDYPHAFLVQEDGGGLRHMVIGGQRCWSFDDIQFKHAVAFRDKFNAAATARWRANHSLETMRRHRVSFEDEIQFLEGSFGRDRKRNEEIRIEIGRLKNLIEKRDAKGADFGHDVDHAADNGEMPPGQDKVALVMTAAAIEETAKRMFEAVDADLRELADDFADLREEQEGDEREIASYCHAALQVCRLKIAGTPSKVSPKRPLPSNPSPEEEAEAAEYSDRLQHHLEKALIESLTKNVIHNDDAGRAFVLGVVHDAIAKGEITGVLAQTPQADAGRRS